MEMVVEWPLCDARAQGVDGNDGVDQWWESEVGEGATFAR